MGRSMDRRRFLKSAGQSTAAWMMARGFPADLGAVAPPSPVRTFSGDVNLPEGFSVQSGETVGFDPGRTTTVRVRANVVVEGVLEMRPANPSVVHTLIFEEVDEGSFVGGGREVYPSDVGLWVVGQGRLDISGYEKSAWNRIGDDASWSSDDELRLAPTAQGDYGEDGFRSFTRGDSVPSVATPYGAIGTGTVFTDIIQSVHRRNIEALAAADITRGCAPGRFCPNEPVTRGQMAAFLDRALGLPAAGSAGFADTSGHVFESEIDRLAAAGVTKGCNPPANTRFCPEEPVTRAQMASFLARALALVPQEAREYKAEVLNLTRNVRIQGTAGGRAHVLIMSAAKQTIRFAELRFLGPRQVEGDGSAPVLGRYGLHFHHAGDGSRGSIVEGVVVRDCGNHAYVPHLSHGVTFRNCISYDTEESAYWWDEGDETRDVLFERCVAALVKDNQEDHNFTLSGFTLGDGSNMTIKGCVAVGVQGLKRTSGFHWPSGLDGSWVFRENLAHNNARNGIFVWQNNGGEHVVDLFHAYHNGSYGILHGAYKNRFEYLDGVLYMNGDGIGLHAVSASTPPLRIERYIVHGPNTLVGLHHQSSVEPSRTTNVSDCRFVSTNNRQVRLTSNGSADLIDFFDCSVGPEDVVFTADANPGGRVRIFVDGSRIATITP